MIKCKKCGSENLDVAKVGPHTKLVCCDCLTFQKFLRDVDRETFLKLKRGDVIAKQCKDCELFHVGAPCNIVDDGRDCDGFIPFDRKGCSYIDGKWRRMKKGE